MTYCRPLALAFARIEIVVVDLINEGKLKASKIGTHRRIRLDDLLQFIEEEDKERDAAMASLIEHTEEMGGYDLK